MNRPGLVVLAGPTAVGKTGLAVALCQRLGCQVVSADSVQVYKGLDIGSAKPTADELAAAPHHLIDVAGPHEHFDAARYVELADEAIARIHGQGGRALVAGGTGLYIKALLHGLMPAPPVDENLRRELAEQWQSRGAKAAHRRLAGLDPATAERLHPNDRQRVLRALEVCLQTGRPMSRGQKDHGFDQQRYPSLLIGLERPREELMRRIEARSRIMWEQGLIKEVKGLLDSGLPPQTRSLATLGYRQAAACLTGEMDEQKALDELIKKTKAYAKRQLTWFRGMRGINWYPADDVKGIARAAGDFWGLGGQLREVD